MSMNMNLTEFLGEFQIEAGEKLDTIASELLRLERDASNPQPVREMFLAAHTIKGGAAMLRLTNVETLAHALEDLLSAIRDGQRALDAAIVDLLFKSIDMLRELIATASANALGAESDVGVLMFANSLRDRASAPAPKRLTRALLVEDSATVRELHRMLLEDAGYEVETCEDAQAALSRAQSDSFDLVVAGLQNANLHGFDLSGALRDRVAVILTSAHANDDLADRARDHGARALVRKDALASAL